MPLPRLEPAVLSLFRSGALAERARKAVASLGSCRCCPRACGVDRASRSGPTGVCRTGRYAIVSSAGPHHGEEPCLVGRGGSGTIFFSGCNLRCVFCQNADISQRPSGTVCAAEEIAARMLDLQDAGCHNINLVTPSHVVPQILEAIVRAVPLGLRLPIVYNSSGYDSPETLRLLDGVVDVYMPDFKFWDGEAAGELAAAPDYPDRAREAILEMHRQAGALRIDADGIARRGVLVRHLVLPGRAADTEAILTWLASEVAADTAVNVMGQYRPAHRVRELAERDAEMKRALTREEWRAASDVAKRLGLRAID